MTPCRRDKPHRAAAAYFKRTKQMSAEIQSNSTLRARGDVIVIGAGLGGMAAAISLAHAGFNVTVYEKNDKVGGKLNVLEKDGFVFDLGPSILTLPHIFQKLFTQVGHDLSDYLSLMPVRPHWRNFFEDGTIFDLNPDPELMQREVHRLGQDANRAVVDFINYARRQYAAVDACYLTPGADNVWDIIRNLSLDTLLKLDFYRTMDRAVCRQLPEPHLQCVFDFFIKYVGSSATAAPAFMNMLTAVQFDYDLWYVEGGMFKLAEAMERLMQRLGVTVRLRSEVLSITSERGFVTGVQLGNGDTMRADWIVSNMEVVPAYRDLLKFEKNVLKKFDRFEPACSGLVIHLGVDKQFSPLAHHNFFYSADQKRHFASVFEEGNLPDDPTVYVVAPTRTNPKLAPESCDIIKVLPHIPHLDEKNPIRDEHYAQLKRRVFEKLERMGLRDLQKHIITEHVWTPVDIRNNYYSHQGAIYGVVTDLRKNFAFKLPKQSQFFKNLFFTGGSVNPGAGMPMVTLCGMQVAQRVLEQYKRSGLR